MKNKGFGKKKPTKKQFEQKFEEKNRSEFVSSQILCNLIFSGGSPQWLWWGGGGGCQKLKVAQYDLKHILEFLRSDEIFEIL